MVKYEAYGMAWIDNSWRVVYSPYVFKKGKSKGKVRVHYKKGSSFRKVIIDSIDDVKPLEQTYERMLLNLLAIIHRDGGHYTDKYGVHQSVDNAMKKVAKLIQEGVEHEEVR